MEGQFRDRVAASRMFRQARGELSAAEFAARLGISEASVERWESGHRFPADSLIRALEVAGVRNELLDVRELLALQRMTCETRRFMNDPRLLYLRWRALMDGKAKLVGWAVGVGAFLALGAVVAAPSMEEQMYHAPLPGVGTPHQPKIAPDPAAKVIPQSTAPVPAMPTRDGARPMPGPIPSAAPKSAISPISTPLPTVGVPSPIPSLPPVRVKCPHPCPLPDSLKIGGLQISL